MDRMKDSFNERLATEARRWFRLRVPYSFRGKSTRGCDCGGFLVGVINAVLNQDRKLPTYTKDWNLHAGSEDVLQEALEKYGEEKTKEEMHGGDVLLFKFGRYNSHTGIFIGDYKFVHCHEASRKCCIDVLLNSTWQKRLKKVYRLDEKKLKKI
jgi:cell wall-associated NlpC family hydrolase